MSLSPVLLLALSVGNPAWVRKANVPEPRIFEIAATINGRIFAVTSGEDGKPGTEVFVYDPAADTWTRRAGHANLVRHSFGAAALDGKIYIWGGIADRRLTGSAEVYDPAADCWTSIAPLPRPRMFAKGAGVNGKLYAVGGIVPPGRNQAPFIDEFDPKTNRWTTKSDMPVKRDAYRVAAAGDRIYVVGNLNGGAEALEYDPAADRWAVKAPMPTPRFDFGVVESGGRVYTFGGMGTNTLEVYDPPTNTWIRKPAMPRNNWEQVAAEAAGKIYVIGGGFPAGSVLDLVYEYDPGVEQAADWAPRAAMPKARPFPHQWPAVIGGRIYAILDGEGSVLEFDPQKNVWSDRHAPMPTKRHHYATVVAGGKLYVLGGCTGGEGGKHERIAAVEEYDPSTNTWRARKPMPTPRMGLGAAALGG